MPNVVAVDPRLVVLSPAPIPPDWIIDGDPRAASAEIARSADGACATCVWATTPGVFRWHFKGDEIVTIVEGEVYVCDENGAHERRLGPGDTAVFPAGSTQIWRVTRPLRKVAVCRNALPPAAGAALRALGRLTALMRGARADVARAA
ncbi:MAG: DUF861 domain-containing protein [Methylobacteriaceae bacterium]|nr:DUF861 domain-containing protein [Methylobacteriaceae bacterium]